MAKKAAPKKPQPTSREAAVMRGESNEPLRGEDLSPQTMRVTSENLKVRGATQRKALVERAAMLKERVANSTPGTQAAVKALNESRGVQNNLDSGAIKNIPITQNLASGRREDLFRSAEAKMSPGQMYPKGMGWYFSHRGDLNTISEEHGIPQERVVNASAVMAAANSPENEKAATAAFARILTDDPEVQFSKKAAKKAGVDHSSPVRVSALSSRQLAHALSAESAASGTLIGGQAAHIDTRRGSTTERNEAAIGFLRGELTDADVPKLFPAGTQAKLASYRQNIMDASPNGAVQDEYHARYRDTVDPGQGRLDLFGLKGSSEGILGSRSVEDTWMNAISTGQSLESIPGTKTVPAKNVASDSQTYSVPKTATVRGKKESTTLAGNQVAGAAVLHAWNNAATNTAAERISAKADTRLPATAVQEVSWTEAREVGGKDPQATKQAREVEAEEKGKADASRAQGAFDFSNAMSPHIVSGATPRTKRGKEIVGFGR